MKKDNLLGRLLYPARCPLCDERVTREEICGRCLERLHLHLLYEPHLGEGGKQWFESCIAPFHYSEIAEAIHRFKFRNRPGYARCFARYMAREVSEVFSNVPFGGVCSVPMSRERKFERGYNQAELLAKEIAKELALPLLPGLLRKSEQEVPQHLLSAKEREKAIRGTVFQGKSIPAGSCLLLVDDVCTTGSTLNECSRILKEGGAKQVFCVTIAIATKTDRK